MRYLYQSALGAVSLSGTTEQGDDLGFQGTVTNRRGETYAWHAYVRPDGYEMHITHTAGGRPISARVLALSPNWDLGTSIAMACPR